MYLTTTLPNGIRIATENIPSVRSVTVGIWFKTGSRNETPANNGISHFIEHLFFKGTSNRSARQIAESMDAIGGQLNAFTAKEYTCYYARILDQHLPFALELLGDIIQNSLFAEEEIAKERGVVLEEIKLYEDTPDDTVHDLFTQTVLRDHPLGRPVLGTMESVKRIGREEILAYLRQFYTPDNLIVAAAGHLEHEEVVKLVERFLGGSDGRKEEGSFPPLASKPLATMLKTKESEQVHLIVGTRGLAHADPDKFPMFVYDTILGGGMSARLFQELREERGLVYSTYSFHLAYQECGLLGAYAGTSKENAPQAVELIMREFTRLAEERVAAAELHRAKEQLKGSLILSLESTSNRMSRVAKSELFREIAFSPDELITRIDAVTAEEVQTLAQRLRAQPFSLAVIGPLEEKEVEEMAGFLGRET